MNAREALKKYWGFDEFRPVQEEVITSVLKGNDTLALLPTGGGKSICFQVPALIQPGICLVVSPLIALMKDQVQNLNKRGIPALAVFSGMHFREIDTAFDNCIYGKVRFLYLSPERLVTNLAIERIKQMKVNLIAVDEAHCISQWGYDFRPAYMRIAELRETLPDTTVLALTATATPEVVEDIQEQLQFKENNVIRKSFLRKNLAYVVLNEEGKREKLLEILRKVGGSAAVYVRSRKETKDISSFLNQRGVHSDFYHAGLSTADRSRKQEDWLANRIRAIVATNAFGMGIDKPDVRSVVHMDLPDSLEAYFQEAGRAGRDGHKAFSVVLYNDNDRILLEKRLDQSFPDLDLVRQIYKALGSYFQLAAGAGLGQSFDFDLGDFAQTYSFSAVLVYNSLKLLQDEGLIDLTETVFIPSHLKILVNKEELYRYQVSNPGYDHLLKTLLRTYQGAFSNYVNVFEAQLAKFLKVSRKEIVQALKKMQLDGILDFRQQKDTAQLVYTKERLLTENLQFDLKRYNFLKERQKFRISKAIDYARTFRCRSNQLLEYFGEKPEETCGICDVCTGRSGRGVPEDQFERIEEKIRMMLQKRALPMEDIISNFTIQEEDPVLSVMGYLLDNRIIAKSENNLYSLND